MTATRECEPAWSGSPAACKYFGADPDGAYCGHPRSLAITSFGRSPNAMSLDGICTHGDHGKYELWEASAPKSPQPETPK